MTVAPIARGDRHFTYSPGFRFSPAHIDDGDGSLNGDIDPNTRGLLYVAFLRRYGVSPDIAARRPIAERFLGISTRLQGLQYFREVRQQVADGN